MLLHAGAPSDLRAVTDGLALLPFDDGVHLDSEPQRRPRIHA